jgi:hypothetical protein
MEPLMFSKPAIKRRVIALACLALAAVSACGRALPSPLQSPANTPTSTPTASRTNTPVSTATQIATVASTSTAAPSPTVNIQATNAVVFATQTAQAATPTRAPTQTPAATRRVVTSGAGDLVTATPQVLSSAGVAVLAASAQVIRGGPASVTLRTKVGANCTLSEVNGAEKTPVQGLPPQIAAADGGVAWIWVVPQQSATGNVTYEASCGDAGAARFVVQVVP